MKASIKESESDFFCHHSWLMSFFLLLFSVASIVFIILFVNARSNCELRFSQFEQENEGDMKIKIITKSEWLCTVTNAELTDLALPIENIIIIHTATENCSTQAECVLLTQSIQKLHMQSRRLDDIGYNFLIGGDGNIYEGRGWNKEGIHTKGYDGTSLGVAFIGTFNEIAPTERQLNATKSLIKYGVEQKLLYPDYKLYGHRDLIATQSPGDVLYNIIETWPHWFRNRTF